LLIKNQGFDIKEEILLKLWKILALLIVTLVLFAFILFGSPAPERECERSDSGNPGKRHSPPAFFAEIPPSGGAIVWYLGHCGYAVKTRDHFLIFDYQEQRDGQQPKSRPAQPALAAGWINPVEIKDLKVRVFVSHSHEDHYDPAIFAWRTAIPDISYYFGWKASDDPSYSYLVGPRAELKSGGLEIATINSHHSGVPEVAWLVKVDGLVIYHNGDCQPDDAASEHDFLKTQTDRIDLAFVFPVFEEGQKYTIQERDFFKKFRVRAAFPMHAQAGDAMYLGFEKNFEARFPGLAIHVPMKMGQKFVFTKRKIMD
jgi:L-ascorbate metabolism protein UlaG (beta-lactamase superfamily)